MSSQEDLAALAAAQKRVRTLSMELTPGPVLPPSIVPPPSGIALAPIPEPLTARVPLEPLVFRTPPEPLAARTSAEARAEARNDRLQGPPAPAPPGMLSLQPQQQQPRSNPTRLTGGFESSRQERPGTAGGASPRGAGSGGSKMLRKFSKIGKKKDKKDEPEFFVMESSFSKKEGSLAGSLNDDQSSFDSDIKFRPTSSISQQKSFSKDEFGRFSIVTEEEMFLEKKASSSFNVYVTCEERPGCFYECTFQHPMTIAKVCGELCVEFQLGLCKNLAVYRMHIMSPGDTPDSIMTALGPAHKGGEEELADKKMSPTPGPPSLPPRPSAPPDRERRMSTGGEAAGGAKDWRTVLGSGSSPFLLHTATHICVDEIQKVMDERDQPYRFVMMKPQLSQKADLLDIYKDDEWEGSHEHYFWGPLMIEEVPETVVDLDCEKKGWRLEPGGNRKIMVSSTMQPIKAEPGIPRVPLYLVSSPYASFFYNKGHENYYAETEGCPVVVSVEKPTEESKSSLKLLVRADQGDVRSRTFSPNPKEISKVLANIRPNLGGLKLKKIVTDASVQKLLLNYEIHTKLPSQMKFGVLCIKPGQVIDDEMFANTNGSRHYEEFLEFIGEKIKLQGWEHYRGGLDVQKDTTGEYGLYTKYSDVEIMFHVSTLLPFDVADTQHLERKRHLGNDVACIAFMDPGEGGGEGELVFNPLTIASHFIHVWVVVSVNKAATKERGTACYNIDVVNKAGVRPFEPFLPSEEIFEKNEKTRKVILTKLINGEITALAAPQFTHTDRRTRTQLLHEVVKEINAKP